MRNFDNNKEFRFLLVVKFTVGCTHICSPLLELPVQWMGWILAFLAHQTYCEQQRKSCPVQGWGEMVSTVQHSCVLTFDSCGKILFHLRTAKRPISMLLWAEIPWKKPLFWGEVSAADWLELHDYGELECIDWKPKNYLGLSLVLLIVMYHQIVYPT